MRREQSIAAQRRQRQRQVQGIESARMTVEPLSAECVLVPERLNAVAQVEDAELQPGIGSVYRFGSGEKRELPGQIEFRIEQNNREKNERHGADGGSPGNAGR